LALARKQQEENANFSLAATLVVAFLVGQERKEAKVCSLFSLIVRVVFCCLAQKKWVTPILILCKLNYTMGWVLYDVNVTLIIIKVASNIYVFHHFYFFKKMFFCYFLKQFKKS